ncbi:MAG: hypothetical protein OEW45_08440 [Deltaproteobacteria bacterium]|nr:hypothetical protein [Deltaproteobacteria bacterium]
MKKRFSAGEVAPNRRTGQIVTKGIKQKFEKGDAGKKERRFRTNLKIKAELRHFIRIL